jgi:osmotically-inducible protein OsmY
MKGDVQIHRDIAEELEWDPQLRDTELGFAVKDGVVTLSGTVDTYLQKLAAQRAVQRVAGVKAVADELDVKPPSLFARSDTDIAHAAVSALKWNASVPSDTVIVNVEDGWITLEGKVSWWYQRDAAERAVRSLVGVRGVSNVLLVSPPVSETAVSQRIERALARSAHLDAKRIKVELLDGKVTLKGQVHSWAERRRRVAQSPRRGGRGISDSE